MRIAATFPSKQPLKGLEISFSALFDGGNLQAVFEGSFSTSGTVIVSAMITDFTFDDLSSFFHAQVGDRLMPPEKTKVTVGSATITISKVEGDDKLEWVFSIDHFEYDSYTCQSATILRTKNGIQISGDLANAKFGDVTIENAEGKVNSLQSDVNSLQSRINDYEGAHWYEFWKKAAIPGLYIAIGGVETAIGVADGVLQGCKDVVEGVDFAATKAAIPLAEKAVEDVGTAGDGAFQAAQATLQTVDKLSAAAVSLAENGLNLVEKGGEATITAARSALDAYLKALDAALHLAQKAIDDLVRCAEWLAYKAASPALDLAKASTHALDVAKVAVVSVEDIGTGVLDIAESIDKGLFGLLNVTRVELHGTFKEVINGSKPFTAIVDMTILEHQVKSTI